MSKVSSVAREPFLAIVKARLPLLLPSLLLGALLAVLFGEPVNRIASCRSLPVMPETCKGDIWLSKIVLVAAVAVTSYCLALFLGRIVSLATLKAKGAFKGKDFEYTIASLALMGAPVYGWFESGELNLPTLVYFLLAVFVAMHTLALDVIEEWASRSCGVRW